MDNQSQDPSTNVDQNNIAQPVSVTNYQAEGDSQPKKSPWAKIIIIAVAILVIGGGGFAAYYYQAWPFSLFGPNKEKSLTEAVIKMKDMTSGRYAGSVTVSSEQRDMTRPTIKELFSSEKSETDLQYQRDEDRLRSLKNVLDQLVEYQLDNKKYPLELAGSISGDVSSDFFYEALEEGESFSLTTTFELKEATNAVREQFSKAVVNDNTIVITSSDLESNSFYYFYLYKPAKSMYEEMFLGESSELAEYMPSDLSFSVNVAGTSVKADDVTDFEFKIGGELDAKDMIAAAEVELRKIGEIFYGKINKMPSLFFDISELKQKWVQITKNDIVSSGGFLDFSPDFLTESSEKSKKNSQQIFDLLQMALADEVVVIDYSRADEIVNEQEYFVYEINFSRDKFLAYYQKAAEKLNQDYGEDAIFKKDAKVEEYLLSDKFTKLMTYLDANAEFLVSVNKKTGYLEIFRYNVKVIPGGEGKMGEKQLALNLEMKMTDINQEIKVETPTDFMKYEDAVIMLSGMTKEEYRFNKQLDNIQAIRYALTKYHTYTGNYPDNLEQLTLKKSEVTPILDVSSLEREDDCIGCYSLSTNNNLEKKFINHIPNDVFTEQPLVYSLKDDDYALIYTMNIPLKNTDVTDSDIYGSNYLDVNNILSVVPGQNTANKNSFSVELDEALKLDDDGDNLPNIAEEYYGSDASQADTDGDGSADGEEVDGGYDPKGPGKLPYSDRWYNKDFKKSLTPQPIEDLDTDQDGLTDNEEVAFGTDPAIADSDGDQLFDKEEFYIYYTSPLDSDSDNDGYLDGAEVAGGYNPLGPGNMVAQNTPAQ